MGNYKFVQVKGPFKANQDIIQYIREHINSDFIYITDLGIQADMGHVCKINGQTFEIGQREILILNSVKVESLSFMQDETELTLIDCILD